MLHKSEFYFHFLSCDLPFTLLFSDCITGEAKYCVSTVVAVIAFYAPKVRCVFISTKPKRHDTLFFGV